MKYRGGGGGADETTTKPKRMGGRRGRGGGCWGPLRNETKWQGVWQGACEWMRRRHVVVAAAAARKGAECSLPWLVASTGPGVPLLWVACGGGGPSLAALLALDGGVLAHAHGCGGHLWSGRDGQEARVSAALPAQQAAWLWAAAEQAPTGAGSVPAGCGAAGSTPGGTPSCCCSAVR